MSWMAPCDELGDRREPVGLGNSVGSNADAALTFKAVHGRVGNEPLDRAARERELDTVTELHCVNLSPENRFEASPLRGDSTATGTFRRSARIDGNEWQFPRAYRRYTAGVSERAYVEANCGAPRRRSGERKLMFKQACCLWDHPQKLVWSWPKGKHLSSTDRRTSRVKISDNLLSLADVVIE